MVDLPRAKRQSPPAFASAAGPLPPAPSSPTPATSPPPPGGSLPVRPPCLATPATTSPAVPAPSRPNAPDPAVGTRRGRTRMYSLAAPSQPAGTFVVEHVGSQVGLPRPFSRSGASPGEHGPLVLTAPRPNGRVGAGCSLNQRAFRGRCFIRWDFERRVPRRETSGAGPRLPVLVGAPWGPPPRPRAQGP